MAVQLICMANSWREKGRCVAGIGLKSGRWIRPVPPEGGPIDTDDTHIDGQYLQPLDIVEMRLRRPTGATRYQKENQAVIDWDWEVVGEADVDDVLKYCSRSTTVLHSRGKVVEPALLEALAPDRWDSLQLVHATNVTYHQSERNETRWEAAFSLGRFAPDYRIRITDPDATIRLNDGEELSRDCLLTISLTEPIALYDMPELCYKVVASIIELE